MHVHNPLGIVMSVSNLLVCWERWIGMKKSPETCISEVVCFSFVAGLEGFSQVPSEDQQKDSTCRFKSTGSSSTTKPFQLLCSCCSTSRIQLLLESDHLNSHHIKRQLAPTKTPHQKINRYASEDGNCIVSCGLYDFI